MREATTLGLALVLGWTGITLLKGDWHHVGIGALSLLFAVWMVERMIIRGRGF